MKTTLRKTLVWLLALAMLLSILPLSVLAADYPTITPDEPVTFSLDEVTTEVIYTFVPETDGTYVFYTYDNDHDTYGYLLDAQGNVLEEDDDSVGVGNNFQIAYAMTAGTTYRLKARFFNVGYIGQASMLLKKAVAPTAVSFACGDTFESYYGDTGRIEYVFEPADAVSTSVTLTSDNPEVAEVTGLKDVRFRKPGTATLTVTTAEGMSATCEVTVLDAIPLTLNSTVTVSAEKNYSALYRITPEKTAIYGFYAESAYYYLQAFLYDGDGENLLVHEDEWDKNFRLQVELTAGETYLLWVDSNDKNASFAMTAEELLPATAITLNHTAYTGPLDGGVHLKPVYTPVNAIQEAVTWKSSDDTVATVDGDGVVSFLKEGTATITATSEFGFTATCAITVDGYPTISRCETVTANIAVTGTTATFLFTPTVSGTYGFYSNTDRDTFGSIYDATGEEELAYNDDGGVNANFLVTYDMLAGTTYQLKARFLSSTLTGSFDVTVVMLDDRGNTAHNVSDYTITETQHSATCIDCGEAVEGEHTYAGDIPCTVCGYRHTHWVPEFVAAATVHFGICELCTTDVQEPHQLDENGVCTVCGYTSCSHSGLVYDYNSETHWGWCSTCDLDVEEEHTLDETDACTKCDYFVHECVVIEYSYDSTTHWGDCDLCGGYVEEEEHILDENNACTKCDYFVHDCVVPEYGYDSVTHWGWCDVCDEYIEEEHTLDETDACTVCDYFVHDCEVADGKASYDVVTHWGDCAMCGEYVKTEHVFTDGVCACGMVEHEHQLVYEVYKNYHYVGCSVCNPLVLYSEHSFGENGECECGFFEHQCDEDGIDYDNTDHYTVCSQCGVHSVGVYESHTYEEGVCTVCGREQLQGVYIGDTLLTDMMYLSNDGTLSAVLPEGGYARLVGNYLHLHNFVYVGDPDNSRNALYTEMELAIVVSGMNTIHNTDGDGIVAAVGSLMIYSTDNGTLRVIADGDADGIDVTNSAVLHIEDVNLYIESTDHGIEVDSPEGTVSIYNSNVFIQAGDDGIDTDAQLNVENTTLYINTEDNGVDVGYETDAVFRDCNVYIYTRDNCGMDCGGNLSIDGGHYEMNTGEYGIGAQYDVYIMDGEFFFTVGGNTDSILSYGTLFVDESVYGEVDIQRLEGVFPVLMANELVPLNSETVPLWQNGVNAADDLIYTGGTLAFPTVTVVVDGETLTEDVDYTLTWLAESIDGSGTYLAVVEGIGDYAGKKLIAVTVSEGEWVVRKGNTFCLIGGKPLMGLQKIGEKYYYFSTGDGHLKKDVPIWVSADNAYGLPSGSYHADAETGALALSGWYVVNGHTFYRENGVAVKGLKKIDGQYYYFSTGDGHLKKDIPIWVSADNGYGLPSGSYRADAETGALALSGWYVVNGHTFYRENGVVVKGLKKIGDKYYYFSTGDGHLKKGIAIWVPYVNDYAGDGLTGGSYMADAETGALIIA